MCRGLAFGTACHVHTQPLDSCLQLDFYTEWHCSAVSNDVLAVVFSGSTTATDVAPVPCKACGCLWQTGRPWAPGKKLGTPNLHHTFQVIGQVPCTLVHGKNTSWAPREFSEFSFRNSLLKILSVLISSF